MIPEAEDHAFFIKLYHDDEQGLRGHITHVNSRRRQPLRAPEEILAFVDPYLEQMGIRLRSKSRLLLWLMGARRRRPLDPSDPLNG